MPSALQTSIGALRSYLANPPSLTEDPKALIRRRRKRRVRTPVGSDEEQARPIRRKKGAETQLYKSAAFIEDSDDDEAADQAFFEMEKRLRAEMDEVAKNKGIGSLEEGLKKRKRDEVEKRKKAKERVERLVGNDNDEEEEEEVEEVQSRERNGRAGTASDADEEVEEVEERPTPTSRPKRRQSAMRSSPVPSDRPGSEVDMEDDDRNLGSEGDDEDDDDRASVGSIPVIRRRQMSASASPSPSAVPSRAASPDGDEATGSPGPTQKKGKSKRVVIESDDE